MPMNWPTKEKDLEIASTIIEEYLRTQDDDSLGIFEVVVSKDKEVPDVHLADWVVTLSNYYCEKYGTKQGDFVTKMVISRCICGGQVIH